MNDAETIEVLRRLVAELADELEGEFGKVGPELADKRPWSLIQKAREMLEGGIF